MRRCVALGPVIHPPRARSPLQVSLLQVLPVLMLPSSLPGKLRSGRSSKASFARALPASARLQRLSTRTVLIRLRMADLLEFSSLSPRHPKMIRTRRLTALLLESISDSVR